MAEPFATEYHAQELGTIVRKSRISMRDPQQTPELAASLQRSDIAPVELTALRGLGHHDPVAEAQKLIDDARATAESMITQARNAMAAETEAARQRGHELGYCEGQELADRECAGLVAAAEQIAANVARERELLLERSEADIVELAIAIANRLVNSAIEVEPERVIDVCRGAMRKAFQREVLVVLAHPEDLQMLRDAGPAMAHELGGIHQLDFVEERRLGRGSVIVRTPVGEIDATFEAKGEKIVDALRELVDVRRAERRNAN